MIEVAGLRKHFGDVRAVDGIAVIGKAIFPDATLPAFGVIAAWAAVAYALLVWRMRAARD